MLGWINDCIEKLVLDKFSVEVWHAIKEKAGCQVKDGGFLKLEHYPDQSTISLVQAASELSGLTVPQVYEAFGAFFVPYIINEGYENLLCCQGSTLKDWMTNINAIHQHLQTTFPKKMTMPEFWCEENNDGTLSLFYFSSRGSFLAPVASGLVTEVAKRQFELSIVMTRQTTQGVDGAKFTSWIVSTEDLADLPKLRTKQGSSDGIPNQPTSFKCPFTGINVDADDIPDMVVTSDSHSVATGPGGKSPRRCPFDRKRMQAKTSSDLTWTTQSTSEVDDDEDESCSRGGLSPAATRKLFPYHVIINSEFSITQVGQMLPRVIGTNETILYSNEVDEVFEFVKPKPAKWTRSWLRKLEDQEFVLACTLSSAPSDILFKGTVAFLSRNETMLILSPDAKCLEELRDMKLTLSDLPAHGAYRDAVFLREHLSRQMNNALKMEKLSRTLQTEKELLESLIPRHAAEGLRKGQSVQPMLHNNVTMFFSDVVGFTNICNHITPTEVIGMLNRLYGVMDFLANKFRLFKIETIGDAYVCASGLPDSDEEHAINVANFAIAVQHCCRKVLSPLDNSPIELRVGIHTGPCASGIVGVTNPRYCVFGDTVNTTARHESTGAPGKIHCSVTTMLELNRRAEADYKFISRGMVEMKGKGQLPSYWLEPSDPNATVNIKALEKLDAEIMKEVKGMKEYKKAQSVGENRGIKTLEEHIDGVVNICHTEKADIDDTKSCGFSRSSSASNNTPSRRELARMLARSFADTPAKGLSPIRTSQRRARLQRARNDINRVLEVVEQGDIVTSVDG